MNCDVLITESGGWQRGPIFQKHVVDYYLSLNAPELKDGPVHSFWRKGCLPVHLHHGKRSQSISPWEIKQLSTKSNKIGWWLLLGQLICSTTHISARLGTRAHCWKPGRMSMLPLILILWHCFPLFTISDIHLCGKFAGGGFQGASVIRASHSLSPCHPYLIKNIMNLWRCVWLDSFRNYTLWQISFFFFHFEDGLDWFFKTDKGGIVMWFICDHTSAYQNQAYIQTFLNAPLGHKLMDHWSVGSDWITSI